MRDDMLRDVWFWIGLALIGVVVLLAVAGEWCLRAALGC
jgi:hypothetical protein